MFIVVGLHDGRPSERFDAVALINDRQNERQRRRSFQAVDRYRGERREVESACSDGVQVADQRGRRGSPADPALPHVHLRSEGCVGGCCFLLTTHVNEEVLPFYQKEIFTRK